MCRESFPIPSCHDTMALSCLVSGFQTSSHDSIESWLTPAVTATYPLQPQRNTSETPTQWNPATIYNRFINLIGVNSFSYDIYVLRINNFKMPCSYIRTDLATCILEKRFFRRFSLNSNFFILNINKPRTCNKKGASAFPSSVFTRHLYQPSSAISRSVIVSSLLPLFSSNLRVV